MVSNTAFNNSWSKDITIVISQNVIETCSSGCCYSSSGVSNLFGQRAACNLRMIARATGVFTAKTLLRNVYFCNFKNNKRTNSKFNRVFAARQHFNVKFCTVFF